MSDDDNSREYSDVITAYPSIMCSDENGEPLSFPTRRSSDLLTTAAVPTSSVAGGPYTITAAQGTLASDNYRLTFGNGTISVTKASFKVNAVDKSRENRDANPDYTASYTGVQIDDALATADDC